MGKKDLVTRLETKITEDCLNERRTEGECSQSRFTQFRPASLYLARPRYRSKPWGTRSPAGEGTPNGRDSQPRSKERHAKAVKGGLMHHVERLLSMQFSSQPPHPLLPGKFAQPTSSGNLRYRPY